MRFLKVRMDSSSTAITKLSQSSQPITITLTVPFNYLVLTTMEKFLITLKIVPVLNRLLTDNQQNSENLEIKLKSFKLKIKESTKLVNHQLLFHRI